MVSCPPSVKQIGAEESNRCYHLRDVSGNKQLYVLQLMMYRLYLFFTAYPIVFQQNRGWSGEFCHTRGMGFSLTLAEGISGLAFLGIGVGLLIGNAINPFGNIYYRRAAKLAGPGGSVPPECRLPMACVGAVMLPIGLLIFAWTSTPNVHWIVPIMASAPFGCGFLLIFTGMNMFLIDSFRLYAASALAANAVMRSVFRDGVSVVLGAAVHQSRSALGQYA